MPTPDVIFRDYEAEQQQAADERIAAENRVMAVCNALLRQQQTCGKICATCAEKCEPLQAWIDLKGAEE
jgi:hypothetical protein